LELPPNYRLEWGGEYENSTRAQSYIAAGIPVPLLLMVLILVLLFNNLRQPLAIMLTVPLAVIGVTVGLLLANEPFGFMAMLGFLALSGMLIKNAIVLMDEINLELRQGQMPLDALLNAGVSRIRPVVMAAGTTVLGMLPLFQDPFFIGMAVTIIGGLSFATVLTLIIVPVLAALIVRVVGEGPRAKELEQVAPALNPVLYEMPPLAIDAVRQELRLLGGRVREQLDLAMAAILSGRPIDIGPERELAESLRRAYSLVRRLVLVGTGLLRADMDHPNATGDEAANHAD
jgi:hypothetical protein